MQHQSKTTIEQVRDFTSPTESFLCSVKDNTYGIYFQEFRIRDVDSGKVIFEVKREADQAKAAIYVEDDENRTVRYRFTPEFFDIKTIGTNLVFGVGDKPVKNLIMIEKHYYMDELIKSFEFTFPFCIPNTTNTWEAIYEVPKIEEMQMLMMIMNPGSTKSDSFYFVDGDLVMHNRAEYDYATLFGEQEYQRQMQQLEN